MNVRLIALDIDGTLLDPGVPFDAVPADPMSRAVAALIEKGVTVVLASGRMFPGTATIARHLAIEQPLICQQGASVHEQDGSLRHGHSIDETIALELLDYANAHGWPLAWFDSERYLVTRHCEQAQFFADVSQVPIEIHDNPHRSGIRPTGIDIISTRERASAVHADIARRYGNRLSLLDFPSVTAVHAAAASKGSALSTLAEELGSDRSEHCDRYARAAAREILPGTGIEGVVARLQAVADQAG